MPLVLGVTGGIAAGKSLVAAELERLGALVISADALAREVVAPGSPVLAQLVGVFGGGILQPDGALDRAELGRRVFADEALRQRLNTILHPAIADLAETRLRQARQGEAPLVVYDSPLLFEAGADRRVDQVLVVTVDPEVQIARLRQRDGLDREAARQRIAAQWPQADKVARADHVIDNSGSLPAVRVAVQRLFKRLTAPPAAVPEKTSD